jgi:hypothetical protein
MRRILVFAAVVLWAPSALLDAQMVGSGGGARARGFDPNAPRRQVSGAVVNSATGEPIARALVQMMGPMQRADFTDSGGSFRVPEGQVMFIARKPGYVTNTQFGSGRPRGFINVTADMQPVVLRLTPEAIVTGTITGEDGEPLEGVQVALKRQNVVNGRKQSQPQQHASTNEDGVFRAAGLPPGAYYVYAQPRPVTARVAATRSGMGYAPAFYPGVTDISSAAALSVQAGQTVQVDFRLRAQRLFEVSGVVTGSAAGQGAILEVMDPSGGSFDLNLRFNPQDGTFTGKLPGGTYVLRASERGPRGFSSTASTTFTVGRNLSDIRLALQPALSIPIVVNTDFTRTHDDSGRPKGMIGKLAPRQYVSVSASRIDDARSDVYSSMEGPDRPLQTLRGVEPGVYAVQITPVGPWYVKSATYGQTDLLREELVVSQGGDVRAIEVVVRDDGGSVSGSVMSDNAPVDAMVLVVPERRTAAWQPQYASERGGFRINTLAPGEYLLFAFDSVEGLEYTNREALEPYASRATRVTVSNNSSATVTLSLIKRGEP